MKAIAYSIKPYEKESLILANGKKHDLTLISNELNDKTILFAAGKEAVIVSDSDLLEIPLLQELWHKGVKFIIIRSRETARIDLTAATRIGFKIANVPGKDQSVDATSRSIIRNLNAWEKGKCVGSACCCDKVYDLASKKKVNLNHVGLKECN